MTAYEFFRKNKNGIIISDGGMGTMLQANGLPAGQLPEIMVLEHGDILKKVHRAYFKAGARLITTNTFGASRIKLKQAGIEHLMEKINVEAVRLARESTREDVLIVGSVGPTGLLMEPFGTLSRQDAFRNFSEQIRLLKHGGGDAIIIETMGDLGELVEAVRACRFHKMPFIVSMTFDEQSRSLSGTPPDAFAVTVEPYQPLAVGSNCGLGPRQMLRVIDMIAKNTHLPVMAQPNAGLPKLIDGRTVFDCTPDDFAGFGRQLVLAGAGIVGGCCGTTPDHIAALAKAVRGMASVDRSPARMMRLASRTRVCKAGPGEPLLIIGERINPTGRKKLSAQLKTGDFTMLRSDALEQIRAGAMVLDVNSGVPEMDESGLIVRMIHETQMAAPSAAVSVDSNQIEALESGLYAAVGKALLNSINGDISRLERLLPVVAQTGSNFIALAMDETGIPEDAASRIRIIERIIQYAETFGISRDRILVDALVFTVGSQPKQAIETLNAVRHIMEEMGCATSLGVSNVSFGLPARDIISSTFLALAMSQGLSAAIINPLSNRMMETVRAAELLLARDPGAKKYVEFTGSMAAAPADAKPRQPPKSDGPPDTKTEFQDTVANAVIQGDKGYIVSAIDHAIKNGKTPDTVLNSSLIPAISEVGRQYGRGDIYLPQLILAGETMRVAVSHLKPLLAKIGSVSIHGTPFVIGTVEGDIHDIGKNIVAVVLENHGFHVVDLGKDVKKDDFADAVDRYRSPIVGLSALMTTTLPAMAQTAAFLKSRFPKLLIMVGGAVVTAEYASKIQIDGYAREAVEAGETAKRLTGISS